MRDGNDNSDSDKGACQRMDELLCEYVDGTMDPAVQRVFEEYLHINPDLAAHVDELKRTRALLCRYRCQITAPFGFGSRLHREVTDEMMRAQAPMFTATSHRLRQAASLTSVVVAMMVVGLVSGSLIADEAEGLNSASRVDSIFDPAPRAADFLPVQSSARLSTFGSVSLTGPPPGIDPAVARPDSQIERSGEFDSLRVAFVESP